MYKITYAIGAYIDDIRRGIDVIDCLRKDLTAFIAFVLFLRTH